MLQLEVFEVKLNRKGYDDCGNYYGIGERVFSGHFYYLDGRQDYRVIEIRAVNKWQANKVFREKLEYFKALGALRHYV